MTHSGHYEAALSVSALENYALVADMKSEQLAAWQQSSGLTSAELAFIQPVYFPRELIEPLHEASLALLPYMKAGLVLNPLALLSLLVAPFTFKRKPNDRPISV